MTLPPDFADISNIGRSRDKAVCRSGEEKGASFADPNRSS